MTSFNYFFIVGMFPLQVFPRGSFSTWCIFVVSTFGWSTWSSACSRPPSRRSCRTRPPRTSFFLFWRKCQSRFAQIRPILVRHLKTNIFWFHKLYIIDRKQPMQEPTSFDKRKLHGRSEKSFKNQKFLIDSAEICKFLQKVWFTYENLS